MRSHRKNYRQKQSKKRNYRKSNKSSSYKKRRYSRRRNMKGGSSYEWPQEELFRRNGNPFFNNVKAIIAKIKSINPRDPSDDELKQLKDLIEEGVDNSHLKRAINLLLQQTTNFEDIKTNLITLVNIQ